MSGANRSRWAAKLAAIDANLLVALDALIQEVNVTRAASRVGITQSAMSQALGRLRAQFDDPILVRVGRHMEPTPFALRVKERLRDAVAGLEVVVQDRPGFDPSSATTRFVIASVDYLCMVLLPPLWRAVAARAPQVSVAVEALAGGSAAPRLEDGSIDLYVGVHGSTERGLQSAALFTDPLSVVVRAGHPLAGKAPTAQAYVRFPHIHVSPRQEASSLVDRALTERELSRRVAIEVPYFALVPGLLAESDLVATVPRSVARLFVEQHGLVSQRPPLALPTIEVCMAWHPRYAQQPGSVWLRDLVRDIAATL